MTCSPSPLGRHILNYEPPLGFVILTFTMFYGSVDPYDPMLHNTQAMTLNVDNELLLCKVFPAILFGPMLAWFHKLPRSSINTFNELWRVFISQRLCSVRQKRNISSLQTILKHEDESIRDFTRRFEQAIQQIEFYNMDAVLQNFRRSFRLTTTFFHFLSLNSQATMKELYRRADRYSTLENNIRSATQTIMITNHPVEKDKSVGKKQSTSSKGQNEDRKRPRDQSKIAPQFTALNISYERLFPSFATYQLSNGLRLSRQTPLKEINPCDVLITRTMD